MAAMTPTMLLFVEHDGCKGRRMRQQGQRRRNHATLLSGITGVADGGTTAQARHGCTWWGNTNRLADVPAGHHRGNTGHLEGSGNQSHGLRAERS